MKQKGLTDRRSPAYNQKAGAHKDGLHLHVQIQRELNAEVVRVCEDFLQEAAPLLGDATDGRLVFSFQLKENVKGDYSKRKAK